MIIKHLFIITISLFLLISCSVESQPINRGKDACHYCKMNIVDKMHAAEYVTFKGKVYKFDAIECMVNELVSKKKTDPKFTLISDYGNEGAFKDARNATFLISQNIPSPMGAFLSAFSDKKTALEVQKEKGGKLLTWEELITKYSKKK